MRKVDYLLLFVGFTLSVNFIARDHQNFLIALEHLPFLLTILLIIIGSIIGYFGISYICEWCGGATWLAILIVCAAIKLAIAANTANPEFSEYLMVISLGFLFSIVFFAIFTVESNSGVE